MGKRAARRISNLNEVFSMCTVHVRSSQGWETCSLHSWCRPQQHRAVQAMRHDLQYRAVQGVRFIAVQCKAPVTCSTAIVVSEQA
jgi:hypothetical protein